MDSNSDDDNRKPPSKNNNNNNIGNSNEGQARPKRQMKTPFQLETLEKAYAAENYPTEKMRAELSQKLGLSDRQLQMWFCHRRLKDKKENSAKENTTKENTQTSAKKQRKIEPLPESPAEEMRGTGPEPGSDYGSGSGSGSSSYMEHRRAGLDDGMATRRYYDSSPQSVMELRAIACVEAQLGEPLREDGPILGMEFDPLPPDAFGAPIETADQHKWSGYPYEGKTYERRDGKSNKASARAFHEYQFLQDQSNTRSDAYGHLGQSPYHDPSIDTLRGRASPFLHGEESMSRAHVVPGQMSRVRVISQQDKKGHVFTSPHRDDNGLLPREPSTNNRISAPSGSHPFVGPENSDVLSSLPVFPNDDGVRMERKRKFDEAKIAKEVEAHEMRIRKELEKQDILRRKTEERMKKEMERYDRERRKEEERLMREKQREEERSLREQKRELERREKFLQKEYLRAEKKRQKEELRREREAVKRKAAMEKATARKIAKESLDLIEDEQLELMELAAASKGTSSIVQLDYDTLQNLELFRDSLRKFPPESVQLKKPIAMQPWIDSEENIGNLLMVWRFFITFADVLGLWPFTLNEFVQAFHDYDSRLLGEIHVAVLKLIIKDIEDVARTPSTGLGTNQYCVANPEGGHPQIVQGAYMWGFDIRNWQQHLNPLTWLEIFRQLALSAGFGPRLKRRNAAWSLLDDNDKLRGGEDVISTLRSGSAAENAFALMRERGLLAPRRSRHRLTPGTVKFAAFHVLSLEGSKGLTVLDLAEKIQKSGLRDLTTSKTPEASISVALTRDQKLFERIAPSTYCVRAAYRKDPADAETVIAAARKKIQIFENGILGGEDADDVEREEDSEGEVDEDPEVDDVSTSLTINKVSVPSNEVNICSGSGKDNLHSDVSLVQDKSEIELVSFHVHGPKDADDAKTSITEQTLACGGVGTNNVGQEDFEIDESKSGQSWIQGLTEGEYSHLNVEERLNALVTLVGIANEGNSIRAVLEDRLEAANALKKQMWAEAQLDRSRLKEDIVSKFNFSTLIGGKTESQVASSAVDGSQSPLLMDCKKEASPSAAEDQKPLLPAENVQSDLHDVTNDKNLVGQDLSVNPDNFSSQQHGITSKRLRSQFKAFIAHIAEETYVYRSLPLGQDRRRNRYWQFVASASRNDPCSGRIFVELREGKWRVIDSEEAFDALVSSLDPRGVRESHLRIMLQKIENSFKENVRGNMNMESENSVCQTGTTVKGEVVERESSPNCSAGTDNPDGVICGSNADILVTCSLFKIELGRSDKEKKSALRRYQDFQRWMWKECFNTAKLCGMRYGKKRSVQLLATCDMCFDSYPSEQMHCVSCHQTFDTTKKNLNFSAHAIECEEKRTLEPKAFYSFDSSLPLAIKLLKAQLAVFEVSVPQEALESFWTENHRKEWGMKVVMSSSAEEILQLLTLFESAIKRERLSSTFEMTKELLASTSGSARMVADVADLESVPILPWIPKTSSAVALRLFELDASIVFIPREKAQPSEDKPIKIHMKLPSKYSPLKYKEVELKEIKQPERPKEDSFTELRSKRNNSKRGKGGRNQGYGIKLKSKVPTLKTDSSRRSNKEADKLSQALRQQGQRTDVQASGWGRRTVRKRRAEKIVTDDTTLFTRTNNSIGSKNYGGSLRKSGSEEWRFEKTRVDMDIGDNNNSMDEAESDDNDEPEGYEQENWRQDFGGSSNGWNANQMQESEDDVYGDDIGIEAMEDDDSEGEADLSDGSDGGVANKMQIDEDMDSAESEDYSD